MTLRIHAPNPLRVGETANVLVTSDNPGVVSLTYGAGLTGPASVTIEGTRERWLSAIGSGIACVADATDALSARGEAADRCATFCVDLDLRSDVFRRARGYFGGFMTIAASYRDTGAHSNNLNWALLSYDDLLESGSNQYYLRYSHSPTSDSNPSYLTGASAFSPATGVQRIILVMDQTNLYIYLNDGVTPLLSNAHTQASGVMSSPVFFQLRAGRRAAYYMGAMSQTDRVAWMAGNTPAGAVSSWSCAQEPTPGEVIYDLVGTNDLTATAFTDQSSGDYSLPLQDYIDTVPVVPYALVPVTATATTDTTIDATRPRQGVPARASAAEKTETADQCTVTVEAALPPCFEIGPDVTGTAARFPALRRLTVFSQTDGAVTLASDNAKVLVPASVVVVDGFATFDVSISGAVSGVTVTATQDGETATCDVDLSFGVHAVPEMAPNDTLQLFPEWLWTEPHTQGISAVMDDRRASFVSDLDHLLIYDFANQTSAMLDLVAEMFAIYGWNKAAGTTEKVAFLESSLKILRKSGTHYAVKEAIRLVCDAAMIESITIIPGSGNLFNGYYDFDGSINYDSLYHWAKFDVEIYTSDIPYFSDEIKTVITSMINHYKPASRWFENLLIKGIA